jgi:hypothetical protein
MRKKVENIDYFLFFSISYPPTFHDCSELDDPFLRKRDPRASILAPIMRKKKPIRYARNCGKAMTMSPNPIERNPKNCI